MFQMGWLGVVLAVACLESSVLSYKRSAYIGPHRLPHTHIHHPYSKRHFNRPPVYPPKPHLHHGNHVHHVHGASSQQVHGAKPFTYSAGGGHNSFPVGVPFPHSHPAPVAYPNPNLIQQHAVYQAPAVQQPSAYQAPAVQQHTAYQSAPVQRILPLSIPSPTPSPTPAYLPPPTYVPPAATYLPAYLKDDDKGPIHTIPAPNLSPADKPAGFDEFMLKNAAAQANLVLSNYRIKPLHHYQVNEDLGSSKGALFAPDPDPSVPTLKVPPTTDPHSIPSNGQVPLDLYLQQQAEKQQILQEQALQHQALQEQALQHQALQEQALQQQALQHQALQNQALQNQALQQQAVENEHGEQEENGLTAQDLFNLMNYQPNVIPESQLQQHVLQPNVQFYSNPLYLQHSQFMNPQYHNFNYDERSQQSAYGTDSFPLQSLNHYFANPDQSDLDTLNTNEITKKLDQRDTKKTSDNYQTESVEKRPYSTLSSRQVAQALASLSAAGALNNAEHHLNREINDQDEIMKQEESNKPVSIYETSFPTESEENQAQARNIEQDTRPSNYNLIKSEKLTDFDVNLENHVQNGSRVRPKRY